MPLDFCQGWWGVSYLATDKSVRGLWRSDHFLERLSTNPCFSADVFSYSLCVWILDCHFTGVSVECRSLEGRKLRLISFLVCEPISFIRFGTFLAILSSNIAPTLFSSSTSESPITHTLKPFTVFYVSYYFLYFPFFKKVYPWHIHTTIFKMDNQQGPTVEHRELCSVFCSNLNGKRIWKRMDICIRITESLCCTPETITTLLINYSPI